MNLLFVCDSYPPDDSGGYAQLCSDLAGAMRSRGHNVTVLCAGHTRRVHDPSGIAVVRSLSIPVNFGDRWPIPAQQIALQAYRRRRNQMVFRQVVASAKPAAILLWPSDYLDERLLLEAEQTAGITTAYYLAGFCPTQPYPLEQYWQNPGRYRAARMVKSILRPILQRRGREGTGLALRHVMCVSAHEQQRAIRLGVDPDATTVVHNGIALENFAFLGLPSTRRLPSAPLRVLFMGRLVPEKGAHTLVAAVALLRERQPALTVQVTILGSGPEGYVRTLTTAISQSRAADAISMHEWMPRQQIPSFMRNFDVLVLASSIAEALPRAALEAMARGLVVIATPTGGTPEAVRENKTGLLFSVADVDGLAHCLQRVACDLSLCDHLASSARLLVEQEFTVTLTASRVEEHLAAWIQSDQGRAS